MVDITAVFLSKMEWGPYLCFTISQNTSKQSWPEKLQLRGGSLNINVFWSNIYWRKSCQYLPCCPLPPTLGRGSQLNWLPNCVAWNQKLVEFSEQVTNFVLSPDHPGCLEHSLDWWLPSHMEALPRIAACFNTSDLLGCVAFALEISSDASITWLVALAPSHAHTRAPVLVLVLGAAGPGGNHGSPKKEYGC